MAAESEEERRAKEKLRRVEKVEATEMAAGARDLKEGSFIATPSMVVGARRRRMSGMCHRLIFHSFKSEHACFADVGPNWAYLGLYGLLCYDQLRVVMMIACVISIVFCRYPS